MAAVVHIEPVPWPAGFLHLLLLHAIASFPHRVFQNYNIIIYCSMHKFVIHCHSLRIPLEVIKELLVYNDIKTTFICSKIEDLVRKMDTFKCK